MIDVPTPSEIAQARKDAGLTQGELADRVGVSQPALSQIESGNNDPTLSTVQKIAIEINRELA